jgi:hypothetical protein
VDPSWNGLGVAVRLAIHEQPNAIRRPLERNLPDDGEWLGWIGFANAIVRIGRWTGKRYSGHHRYHSHKGMPQRSGRRAPMRVGWEAAGENHISSWSLLQFDFIFLTYGCLFKIAQS